MKKKTLKIFSFIMSLVLVFSVMPLALVPAFASNAIAVQSGTATGNKEISWTLYADGVLTLSGKGKLSDSWTFGKVGLAISGDVKIKDLFEVITKLGSTEEYVKDVKKIIVGEGITSVGNNNFASCVNATEVQLPSTLTSIGKNAFAYTSIASLKIPAGVTKIGESAFYGTKLVSVVFADKAAIKTIDKLAFAKTNLEKLSVPASVESLSADVCTENAEFKGFDVASGNTKYKSGSNGVLFTKDGKTLISYPVGLTADEYSIPTTVTTVKAGAFANKNLVTLRIPAHVTTMEKGAFECPSLREVYNLSSVKLTAGSDANGGAAKYAAVVHTSEYEPSGFYSVGDYKFVTDGKKHTLYDYAGTETSVSLPTDMTFNNRSVLSYNVGANAFAKSAITSVVIPAEVAVIDSGAFSECAKLEIVSFAEGSKLVSVGDAAFKDCSSLVLISLPNGVTSVGKNAFKNCTSLISFNLPDSVKTLGEGAFEGCSALNSFVVTNESALETIGKTAFKNDKALTGINLPEALTTIGDEAFAGCASIVEMDVPAAVKTIGSGAFADCSGLAKVTLAYDSALTEIKKDTFKNCSDLKEFVVPCSVKKIGEGAFGGCINLANIYICNKDCSVDSSKSTISDNAVIYGYSVSSAKNYATLRRRTFKNIKSEHIWSVATCTKPSVCYVCGDVAAEATEHSYSDWEVITAVTCTESGVHMRVCRVCGDKETLIVPALGHAYGDWYYVKDPVNGIAFKERICTACGHKHMQSVAVIDETNAPKNPTVNYILGDVNGDGDITAQDARLALRFAAKLDAVSYVESKAADVNLDGNVTASDARKILRVAAKLEQF